MKKYIVNILPFAEEDLYEIVSYFYNVNKDYANKLYSSINSRIEELELFPEKGSIVPELEKQGFLKYHQLIERNSEAPRDRLTGVGLKPPQAAVIKSHGGGRCREKQIQTCQVSPWKTNESEPLMRCRKVER